MSRALMSRHAKSHEPCRGVCRNRVSSFQVCLTGCLLIVGVSFVVAVFFSLVFGGSVSFNNHDLRMDEFSQKHDTLYPT